MLKNVIKYKIRLIMLRRLFLSFLYLCHVKMNQLTLNDYERKYFP